MGKRYVQHSDMCGCERCARQWETDNPQPVYDAIEDANILDCGCERGYCDCWRFEQFDEED